MMGHRVGLEENYLRPVEQDVQSQYEMAINSLTITPENRLKRQVQKLEVERDSFEVLRAQIEVIERKMDK
jgi:hypothetical protein